MSRVKLDILASENGDLQVIVSSHDKNMSDQGQITPDELRLPQATDTYIYHNRCCFIAKKQQLARAGFSEDVERSTSEDMNHNVSEKTRVGKLWKDFLGHCTLHGFHYCFEGNLPLRRVLWSLLLVGAFAMFVEKCTDSVINYFDYPFSTATVIDYTDKLDFPAVSLCNFNDVRMSKINGSAMDLNYKDKLAGRKPKANIQGDEIQKTTERAAHHQKDMILSCSWNKEKNCNWKNFSVFKNSDGDTCYTFNSAREGKPILQTKNPGEKYGLTLIIDIQHFDYYYGSSEAGFKVILHDQIETPVKMQGYAVAPGYTTYFSLKKRKIVNLPYPYKTRCAMPKLKYFNNRYTKSTCFLDRLTQYVVRKCACRDWIMPGNSPLCSFETLQECAWKAWVYFEENRLDKCPVACESIEYSATMSYSMFPSNVEADKMASKRGMTGNKAESKQFLRENLLQIKLYFEDFTYETVKQVPSYDVYNLLGDVGGQLGLFLGASCLTVAEYINFAIMLAYTKLKF